MPTASEQGYALSQAYRQGQARQSALVALLVATYYDKLVNASDPASVGKWLDLMVPRILGTSRATSALAAQYVAALRQLELPLEQKIAFDPLPGSVEEQVRTSLAVVGPSSYVNKARKIERMDEPPVVKKALLTQAKASSTSDVIAASMRHAQSGGRATILGASSSDKLALGYVRVTAANPCYFCAMLASRGLVFAEDSFNVSDPRFTGDGTAKVHDNCKCGMAPVYNRKSDKALEATQVYTDMWERWGAGGGTHQALLRFRRGYEEYQKTGTFLDWDVVNDKTAFMARNAA